MTEFGVHSEVGKLRKVMVHRPDLSLQRLTPSNHDELLFDDVLWVERAQYEHDQFVAQMRERGVEVFLLSDLLAEALAASERGPPAADRARRVRVHGRLVARRRDPRAARRTRAGRARQAPHRRAHRRRGGPRPRDARQVVADRRRARRPERRSCSRRCPTRCSPATRRAGSTGASRSTRCTGRLGAARRTTSPPSTRPTRCSPTPTSSSGTRTRAPTAGSRPTDFGLASMEGGDVMPIGNGDGAHRDERAHAGTDDRAGRQGAVRQGRRRAGHRLRDDQGPRPHAPRHRVHAARPRQGDRVPEGRRQHQSGQPAPGHERRATSTSPSRTTSSARSPTRSA